MLNRIKYNRISQNIKSCFLWITPPFLKRWYLHEWKKQYGIENGHFQFSFSQQAEDLHILRILGDQKSGFYIDIGAYHPFQYSNTHLFYSKGWNGINIEPNPTSYLLFKKYRIRDKNINVAVGRNEEELTYYMFNTPAVNTFSKSHADEWAAKPGHQLVESISVKTIPLATLLANEMGKNRSIDFMTIDVESWDMEVLQSNDWSLYRPKLLLVEVSLDPQSAPNDSVIVSFLKDKMYHLECVTGGTFIFKTEV